MSSSTFSMSQFSTRLLLVRITSAVGGASPRGDLPAARSRDIFGNHADPAAIGAPRRRRGAVPGFPVRKVAHANRTPCRQIEAAEGRSAFSKVFDCTVPDENAGAGVMKADQPEHEYRGGQCELHDRTTLLPSCASPLSRRSGPRERSRRPRLAPLAPSPPSGLWSLARRAHRTGCTGRRGQHDLSDSTLSPADDRTKHEHRCWVRRRVWHH